jgi:hypothetical protein
MRVFLACLLLAAATPALAGPGDGTQTSQGPSAADVAAQVDALFEQVWKEAGLEPRKRSTDAEFLRRASLDVAGAIPSSEQALRFLLDASPDKRERLITELLEDTGYARTMALRWAYLLVGRDFLFRAMNQRAGAMRRMDSMEESESSYDAGPVPPLVGWLEDKLDADEGWDAITTGLLSATGEVPQNGAAQYIVRYARDGKAEEITGNAMRVFQGLQIQCAQCHDHPYTDWTQQDFYGVAAFFARIAARRERDENGKQRGPFIVLERKAGQIRIPGAPGERGRMVLPRFLTGQVIRPSAPDRRDQLAKLITADANPWFAKATVNRIWSFFFGRGLQGPVDDLETADQNPAPQVLSLLERDFRASGYDVRRLCEIILRTRVYQVTSAGPEEGRPEELAVFARAPLRNLSAEQLFYSVLEATGAEDMRPDDRRQRRRVERLKFTLLRQFLQTFTSDEAGEEGAQEGTIPQALLLLNGPLTNDAVRPRPGHPLYDALFALRDPDARVDMIYLRVLSRPPSKQEKTVARKLLTAVGPRNAKGTAEAYADLVWSLLNSPEFAFNH